MQGHMRYVFNQFFFVFCVRVWPKKKANSSHSSSHNIWVYSFIIPSCFTRFTAFRLAIAVSVFFERLLADDCNFAVNCQLNCERRSPAISWFPTENFTINLQKFSNSHLGETNKVLKPFFKASLSPFLPFKKDLNPFRSQ